MNKATAPIYQLKLQLGGITPPIWRRILVSGDIPLGKLHEVIQDTMGWTNSHLHDFVIDGETYSDPEAEIDDSQDENRYRLVQMAPRTGKKFDYLYDPGDGWEHKIVVEKIVEADQRYAGETGCPVCIAGARACPPEDCGGPFGYAEFLTAITNPRHKQNKEMRDWIGGDFDPERFDLVEINDLLNASNEMPG